jgi:hypothetical protein
VEDGEGADGRKVISRRLGIFGLHGVPVHIADHQTGHHAWPGVALPRPELRSPEHQDRAEDHRPPGE